MRGHQPNLRISKFFRQRFFYWLQPLFAKLLDCRGNLRISLRDEPLGIELYFAVFHQLRDHFYYGGDLAAANLRYFFKRASFLQKLQRIFPRLRGRRMPIIAGPFSLIEPLQRT